LQDVRPLRTYYRGMVVGVLGESVSDSMRSRSVNKRSEWRSDACGAIREQNWRIRRRNLFFRTGFPQDLHALSTSFPQAPMSLEWRVLVGSGQMT